MWIILVLILTGYSYWDIREKAISVRWLAAGLMAAVMLSVLGGMQETDLWRSVCRCLCGMLPGILLVLLTLIHKEKMGCGDGVVLAVIGGITGVEYALAIFLAALILSFIYSCFLLVVCRKEKTYCFPFIPFYLLGVAAVCFLTTV